MKHHEEEFTKLLLATAEIFDKKLSSLTLEMYYEALIDYPFEEVKRAFSYAIKRGCKFFPRPAEIVEIIEGKSDVDLRPDVAWGALLTAVRKIGGYNSVLFDDPAIAAAVVFSSVGNWVNLCNRTSKELSFFKSEFKNLYSYYASKEVKPRVLPGLEEIDCNKLGEPKEKWPKPYVVITGANLTPMQRTAFIELAKKRNALEGVRLVPSIKVR